MRIIFCRILPVQVKKRRKIIRQSSKKNVQNFSYPSLSYPHYSWNMEFCFTYLLQLLLVPTACLSTYQHSSWKWARSSLCSTTPRPEVRSYQHSTQPPQQLNARAAFEGSPIDCAIIGTRWLHVGLTTSYRSWRRREFSVDHRPFLVRILLMRDSTLSPCDVHCSCFALIGRVGEVMFACCVCNQKFSLK